MMVKSQARRSLPARHIRRFSRPSSERVLDQVVGADASPVSTRA
jgi:hypothetical protein